MGKEIGSLVKITVHELDDGRSFVGQTFEGKMDFMYHFLKKACFVKTPTVSLGERKEVTKWLYAEAQKSDAPLRVERSKVTDSYTLEIPANSLNK